MGPLHPNEIAGGKVNRTFRMGDRQLLAGTMLTRDEILRMPTQNRTALIDTNHMSVWPQQAMGTTTGSGMDRHVSSSGFGRYDVIEGRKLNDKHLTREEAYRLAGLPLPDAKAS